MNPDPSDISSGLFILSAVTIVLSVPLILRMVRMNGVYRVKIPEAFRSYERWFQINRFGGIALPIWGMAVGITGAIGLIIARSQGLEFGLISLCVVLGGLALVTIAIFVYVAKTKMDQRRAPGQKMSHF
jgi:hypothetical protein